MNLCESSDFNGREGIPFMQSDYIIEMLNIRKEFPGIVANEQGLQEAILKELSRHEPRNQQAISIELSRDESCCSTGNNQARDQAGITQLSWQLSSR